MTLGTWTDLSRITKRVNQTTIGFDQATLKTARMIMEPITEDHAEELTGFFGDSELHHFVPFQAPTLEQQRERCQRWAKRRSPDGKELGLNGSDATLRVADRRPISKPG